MPNTAEQAIYNRLASAPTFHPASAKLLPTDWTLEPGDVVTVKSGETSYSVPVYSMGLTWNANSQNETCESATTRIAVESTGGQTREPLPELQRKQFEQDRYAYTNFKEHKQEIDEHWQHIVNVTDQGMEDCFGVIGVKLDADHKPIKDAQGNYVWAGPNDSPAEIWNHLHRNAWSNQILNHIKDANGNIISLAEVYTDAYGNAIINAINDQRTGTATINADRVRIGGAVTIGDAFGISNGSLLVKPMAIFGDSGNLVTINNGKVSADTVQINSTGSLKFGDGTGYGYRSIDSSTAGNLVTGFGTATESGGQISIPYYTVGIPSGSGATAGNINFNIAATQFYIDGVAAARAQGQSDAASQLTTLYISSNGTYTAPFGYSQVTVDVASVSNARLLVRQNAGATVTELINGERVTLTPGEYCEVDIESNGSYIKWGEVAAPSGPVQIFYCNESLADGKAKIQFSDGSYSEYNLTIVGYAPYNNM